MYIKLSGCIQAGLWIAIVFFQIVVMGDNSSDTTMQPSHEFSITAVTSSSTIQDRPSPQSFNQQSLEISPTRTLQTSSAQGNSVVMSDTHVQASSFTPLIIPHTTDSVHISSSSGLFKNQLIDSSIKTSDTIVENKTTESSVVSVSALVMTILSTNIDSSENIVPVSLMTSFNELSSSTVLNSNSESERSDIVSDFNNDVKGTESYTLKTFLTDSLISKSVIINITSSRTFSYTSSEMLDISSSSNIGHSHVILSDNSVALPTWSERANEIKTKSLTILSSNPLGSSLSVDQSVTENSFSSPVFNTDMIGKSNYELSSRMSTSQLVTPPSGSFFALTSSTATKYSNEHATSETNSLVDTPGETISFVPENSSQTASSFNFDQMHSLSELSEEFVSKSHNHVFESISTHVLSISPSFITNSVFDSMQTFYSASMEGTLTKHLKITTTIGTDQSTRAYIPTADTMSVYSEVTVPPLMSLSGDKNVSKNSTTYLSPTTSQIWTGNLTSLLDIQSYSTSEHSSGTSETYSVDQYSTRVLKSYTGQQHSSIHNDESTARFAAPSIISSMNEFSTKVLHATSPEYLESFLSTVDTVDFVTQIKTSASRFVTESVHSNHIQISSNYTQSDTLATRFAAEVSKILSLPATTPATAQNTFVSITERILNSELSSLQSLESNISPTPTEQIKLTDGLESITINNLTKRSLTENLSFSFSTEIVEEITASRASSNQSTITGTNFSTLTSSNTNEVISLISDTESLRNNERNFTSTTSAADISTPFNPTKAHLNSVSTGDSSDTNFQSRTSSSMDLSKLPSDMIDTSAYSKAISSNAEKGREEMTLAGISSTWSSNSFSTSNPTDEAVSLLTDNSLRSIDSTHTDQQSASSWSEMKSSKYLISSDGNSADFLPSSLMLSAISSTYPLSFGSESITSWSSISMLNINASYSKANESQTKVSDVSFPFYSHNSFSISETDAKSVIPSTTVRHDKSTLSRIFSSSSDQLVSTSFDIPKESSDKINSIASYSKTDILRLASTSLVSSMIAPSNSDLITTKSTLLKSYIESLTSPLDSKHTQSLLSTLSAASLVTSTNYTRKTFITGLFTFGSANSMSIEPSPVTTFSGISESQTSDSAIHSEVFDTLTSSDLLDNNVFTTSDQTLKIVTAISIEGSSSLVDPRNHSQSFTTGLSFSDILSIPSNTYTMFPSIVSTLSDLSNHGTNTASTGQTTVSLISKESSVTTFVAKSASAEINSSPSYTSMYQTPFELSSTSPSTKTELLSTESKSDRISSSTPLNYSLIAPSQTVLNNTVLATISELLNYSSIDSTTSNMVTLQQNASSQSLFASLSKSSIETYTGSNIASTQSVAFENTQPGSSPLFSTTSYFKTNSTYTRAGNSHTDIPNVNASSELLNTNNLTTTNQPVTSTNEEVSTSFILFVSSSDMYHFSSYVSSTHISIGLSTVDPSATTTDLLSSERISSTFSEHSITSSSILSNTNISVPLNSNLLTNIAPTRTILPTDSFVILPTSAFDKHEGNVSSESPFSIFSTIELSTNLVINDSNERLTIESTHPESFSTLSVSSYMDKSETDISGSYNHSMPKDLLVSSYVSNTLSTISTDQRVISSKTITNGELLSNITSKSSEIHSSTGLSPSYDSLGLTSSGFSTLSLPPSMTKLSTEFYSFSHRMSSSLLLSSLIVFSSIIPSSLPRHSVSSTHSIIISPTSSIFTKQGNVSQSLFSNLSTSSMMFSNGFRNNISSEITETNNFSAITDTVFDGTKSELSTPVAHVSITSSSLTYSTNYNNISITSTGGSISSEDSLIYTSSTPDVSEAFSTISSMLITSDHVRTIVNYTSVWITDSLESGEVSDSTLQLEQTNSFAHTMSESSLPSFTLQSTLQVSPISQYVGTLSASPEISNTNNMFNSTSLSDLSTMNVNASFITGIGDSRSSESILNATYHSSIFATLPSTHIEISQNISVTPASSVSILPSSSAQITQGVYSTKMSSSNIDFNVSSFENIATRTMFDTTIIDTTIESFSFNISMNSSFTQISPEYNVTASLNSSTTFLSATVTDVFDSLSIMSTQPSFSGYTLSSTIGTVASITTRNDLNISTLLPSPTLTSSILKSHSLLDVSESNSNISHTIESRSLREESSLSRVTPAVSLSTTDIILISTLDSSDISVLYPSPSILSTLISPEQLLSPNLTLPSSHDTSDSITVLSTSTIVSTIPMTSLLLDSFGLESSINVTITDTFIDTVTDSESSLFTQTLFSEGLLSSYVTPLFSSSTSTKTTTLNTTMLLFTDVSSISVNISEISISSIFASSNITTTSGFQSSMSTMEFLENATAESFLPSSFSSSYLTSNESRIDQFSSILTTGEYSNTFSDTSESMFSIVKSPIIEHSLTLATPELSSTKSSSIPMLSSVSHALTTTLQILSNMKDVSSEDGSTMLTNLVSRTFNSELITESSKMTLTLSHDSSFSSPPSASPLPSNVVSSFIESSVHPSSYFSSILSMSPVVSQKLSSSERTLAVESSLESSRYSETLFSVLPASTTTLVMSSTDVLESIKPIDSKSLSPHTDTASTELLTVSSLFTTQSDMTTDIISSTIAPVSTVESTIDFTTPPATISPTSSSNFVTNDSDYATSFLMTSMESINSTDVQSQNISVGNETLVTFSITPSLSSVVETVSVSSSIFNPTTEPPEVTTVNITNIEEAFWVRTVLKIQRWVNITDPNFVKEMEGRLAEAYNEAFIRLKLIQEGKFEPLQRRRRKKRFASIGEAAVHIHDMTRKKDSSTVTVVYAVERSGEIMTAQNAVTTLQVLDDQELAIILRQVVGIKAETYGQTPEREVTTDDNFPLWMIGAIAGGAAAVVIFLWIVICIYCKCCKRKDSDVEAEPELMSIIPESPKGKDSPLRPLPQTPVKKPLEQQTTSQYSFKKANNYKMSVPHREPAETIDERTVLETPVRREPPPKPPQHSSPECSTNVTPVLPKRELAPPGVEKGRRNSKNSIGPSINELELRRESVLSKDRKTEISQLFQSTVSEDSDGVKEQIKAEKMKNKELLRDKYGQDVDMCADSGHQYDSTDRIMLDLPSTPVPNYGIANGTPPKKPPTDQSRHSDGEPQGGENLEEAKTRMHQLLDDAFSLISPRKHEDFSGKRNSLPSNKEPELPFSGYTNPAYSHSSSDYFETWSPYRASDQVALISMPHTLVSSVTKLGQKSDKRFTATKIGKRPASNLDILNTRVPASQPSENNKSSSGTIMTKEPPEPILLRTKDDNSNQRLNSIGSRTSFSNLRPNNGKTQTSKLNSGLILNGSVTSLSKLSSTDLSRNRKESVEMKPLNQNGWNTIRNHRVPDKNLRNTDELDVIQSIQPHERTDNLIKSLRDEIKSLSKPETEEDINKKPIRRKNRKVNKPMTDIM